ncbi:MAG: NUDIX hydrolase [Actinomycetota bacterium]|nr:NUDIX hydrolase [Actinomycetota bacterium]
MEYAPRPNEARLILADTLPPRELITSAFALAFQGDCLLLTDLGLRGWDFHGGHVEEETGTRLGPARLLGYQLLRVLAPRSEAYKYPYPDSYQVFYYDCAASVDPFTPTRESWGAGLLPPDRAREIRWVRLNLELYEAALRLARC